MRGSRVGFVCVLLAGFVMLGGCKGRTEEILQEPAVIETESREPETESQGGMEEAPEAVQEATENQTTEEERETEAQDSEIRDSEIQDSEDGKVQESYTEAPGNSQETDDSSLEEPYEDADTYFAELQALEEKEQALYASIPGDTVSINGAVDTACTWWDDELNEIYQVLKAGMSQEEADALIEEELEWIDYRDSESMKAWDEFVDKETGTVGTGATGAYIAKKLEITKERVYELADRVYY